MNTYSKKYYQQNCQLEDRPALWFYARLVRSWLAPGPVLDFGCGTGFLMRRLRADLLVAGLELSGYCRERLESDLPEVPVYAEVSVLPKDTFSGVVALHVFEHIPDVELTGVLHELHKSLRPEGRMLCVMPDAGGRGMRLKGSNWSGYHDSTHVNLKTAKEWQDFFFLNGFSVMHSGTDGLWDFPYSYRWVWLDCLRYAWGTVFQFLLGRLLLPVGSGESVVFLLQRE